MPVRSPLNPEAITGNPPASLESFQNFISGGSPIGQSAVDAAGQQDIGFQRASVKAVNPDISSIVNTISSNIQNELNSAIQNVTNIVNRNVVDKIKDNNKLLVRQIGNIVERRDSAVTNLQNSVKNITQENNKVIQNVTGDLQKQIDSVKESKSKSPLGGNVGSSNIMNEVKQLIDKSTNITNRSVDRKIKDVGTGLSTQIQQVRQSQGSQVTQVQNALQNVRQETNNIVQKLTGDYQKKIKDIDTSQPNNILDKFLDTYNNALQFIQFFGNKKNVDALRKNLKNLVTSFTESFEVAKLVRQTLFKIVQQLSNLPKASPGRGSGINLDVNMPRQAPPKVKPKGRMGGRLSRLALPFAGAAALIGGGAMAVNALEDKPEIQKEDQKFDFLDSLQGIVGGMRDFIMGLIPKDKDDPPEPGGTQPVSSSGTNTTGSTVAGENLAAVTATLEATGLQNQADAMQVMLNRVDNPLTPYGDLFGQLTEEAQFSPISAMIYDTPSKDPDAERVYSSLRAKLGATPDERIKKIKELTSGTDGIKNFADFIGKPEIAAQASDVLRQFKNDTSVAANSRDYVGDLISFRGYEPPGVSSKRRGPGGNYFFTSGGKIGKIPVATIDPNAKGGFDLVNGLQRGPEQIDSIYQPVPAQSDAGSASVVPLDLSGAAPQKQQSGRSAPTISAGRNKGPTSPRLSSGDSENFLTMYSKLTYNIVDG